MHSSRKRFLLYAKNCQKTNENYGHGNKYTKHNQPDKDLVFDD
ncbi:hypothetical protein E9M_08161 [Moraxella catarrhalis 46P47B1]|uniref:Uncharacterized protein n=1 Tax=Moraxella catarrhalis TaxID=480 RepID=A0A3S9QGX6_MORCA|nr:hypothetical protein MCR_1410 [Moraxella catarrhalis BBH18]AZQ87877.1 hypothetical protein EJK52_1472 [Moraxella catarrhalis]EGE10436.1 hypothetical protein E9M_08161 [Moraxella catarrhalis 46P47B1]AZQ88757.1 hypothetical protein EJK50_1541 [Moraxella catarrhalis]AZQ91647.1 hypothetical protein EJK51_1471 [Moraxella catarrhalis]